MCKNFLLLKLFFISVLFITEMDKKKFTRYNKKKLMQKFKEK